MSFFQKIFFYFFYNQKSNNKPKENLKNFFEQTQNNDLFISPIMQKATIPTRWTFFGEKETLEESNEPSLIQLR